MNFSTFKKQENTEELQSPTTEQPPFDFSQQGVDESANTTDIPDSPASPEAPSTQTSSLLNPEDQSTQTFPDTQSTQDKENISPNIDYQQPEGQEMPVSNQLNANRNDKNEWLYPLSNRTLLKLSPTCQVQFEVGPLIEDPSIVKALLNFPVSAVKKLYQKINSLQEFVTSPGVYTKKEHLSNQWYVQVYVPDKHTEKEHTVNLLSINRKGIPNFKVSIFMTLQEFDTLVFVFPHLMKQIDTHHNLLSSSISTINDKIRPTNSQSSKQGLFYSYVGAFGGPPESPHLFFSKSDAIKHASLNSRTPVYGEHIEVKEVYKTPPPITKFLRNCLLYITHNYFVNHLHCMYDPSEEAVQYYLDHTTPKEFQEWLRNYTFPIKFLEVCYSSFYLSIGLQPPLGVDTYITCLSDFIHPSNLLKELFDENLVLSLSLDCSPGEKLLMQQINKDLHPSPRQI